MKDFIGSACVYEYHCPISVLALVTKIFGKLLSSKIADDFQRCGFFSDFYYVFRSSQSAGRMLTFVSDRIFKGFNRSVVTQTVTLKIQLIRLSSQQLPKAGLVETK